MAASNQFFDAKHFNPEAFGRYIESAPDLRRNKLLESGAIVRDAELGAMFGNQTGSYFATRVFFGNLEGEPDNYDGNTDITAESTDTYRQGVFTIGRAKGFTERDFSKDVTSGVDFMENVRRKLIKYWNDRDQDLLLSLLKGVFNMTGEKNQPFVQEHTSDISDQLGELAYVGATTLNNAIQKAGGDNKDAFVMAIMHSQVATHLENMKLLEYMTFTDANGIERTLTLATWNGRIVMIDDGMPTESIEMEDQQHTQYTTYVLGRGAISLEPIEADVPYEMDRDPKKNGGQTTLYTRKRQAIAVEGISYNPNHQNSLSPLRTELEKGAAWDLIQSTNGRRWDHKAIPIARIISQG